MTGWRERVMVWSVSVFGHGDMGDVDCLDWSLGLVDKEVGEC